MLRKGATGSSSRHDRAHAPQRSASAATRPLRIRHLKSETFGPYTLREQIGEGSTCAVHVAEHRDSHEPRAIKVLHRKLLGDPTHARRMLDEANMISTLHHPSIVEVFDIGTSSAGRPYVVLERLIGEPLSERLMHGPLSQERIAGFTRQLASALDLAHTNGIVHRDLKPENMYLVADASAPGGERIKLLDFGIAKREASTFNTQTGIVLGTPAYMAPEQALGVRRVDGRVDIYALGIVMYVMATGTLPFTGVNTEEMLAEHAYVDPVPPHELANIAPELSAIIQRCLAKRPDDRYPRMTDLDAAVAAFEAQLRGEPPPAKLERARPLLPGVDARPERPAVPPPLPPARRGAPRATAASDPLDAAKTVVRRDVPAAPGSDTASGLLDAAKTVVRRDVGAAPDAASGLLDAAKTVVRRDVGAASGSADDPLDAAKTVRRDIARLVAAADRPEGSRDVERVVAADRPERSRDVARLVGAAGRPEPSRALRDARSTRPVAGVHPIEGDARESGSLTRSWSPWHWRAWAAERAVERWPWRRLLAFGAPTAVALVIAIVVGLAPARVDFTPTAVAPPAPPAIEPVPAKRLEPPALTRRQVRKPQPVIERDREPILERDRTPPAAHRATTSPLSAPARVATAPAPVSKKLAAVATPSKPKASAPAKRAGWDPNALFFEKH